MPKGKPHPRLSSSDDDEDDTTPLCELKGVQAAKTAKTAVAAFKEKAAADNWAISRRTRDVSFNADTNTICANLLVLATYMRHTLLRQIYHQRD